MNEQTQPAYKQFMQELFNRMYLHAVEQGVGSYDRQQDNCFYRRWSSDNRLLKCVVGCLIPDEHYDEDLEHRGVSTPEVRWTLSAVFPEHAYHFRDDNLDNPVYLMLAAMQQAHDGAARHYNDDGFVQSFKARAQCVADSYGLEIPVIETTN